MLKPYSNLRDTFCYSCRTNVPVVKDLLPENWRWVFYVVGRTRDGQDVKAHIALCPQCHNKGLWRV
jgi:hypothetical protein